MARATPPRPEYSRTQVNLAGKILLDPPLSTTKFAESLATLNNWRSSHSPPLDILRKKLRRDSENVDDNCIVAQRIKRLPSILQKLRIFPLMKLSQIQAIGGCRAILRNVQLVDVLFSKFQERNWQHTLCHVDDYIRNPKDSGYRGVHLVYKFFSDSERNKHYNGLKIEMQLRSVPQHNWATAVETVGTFIGQALKSSQGEEDWLRFFALMGTVYALEEGTSPVPNTPTDGEQLQEELRYFVKRLDVFNKLTTFREALFRVANRPIAADTKYFLLHLDSAGKALEILGYNKNQFSQASNRYLAIEEEVRGKPGADVVLVSADSISSLKRAYPNYFLDTRKFLIKVSKALNL